MKNLYPIALVIAISLTSAPATAQTSPVKELFAGKCAACHGADGSSSTGVGRSLKIPSFHSPDVQNHPDADLKAMITKGKGAMPSFAGKLTDSQIDELVIYIRALGKK